MWSSAASVRFGRHEFQLAATYAKHEYDFARDADADGREEITDGNELDSAPRWIAHAAWRTAFSDTLKHELEVNRVGSHFRQCSKYRALQGPLRCELAIAVAGQCQHRNQPEGDEPTGRALRRSR